MSQKYIKSKNNNTKSPAYGKYFAKAVYDEKFVETDDIADFIQTQDCTAATITTRRVLFSPEKERIVVGSTIKDGKIIQEYVNAKTLVKDVAFEETHDNAMNVPVEP